MKRTMFRCLAAVAVAIAAPQALAQDNTADNTDAGTVVSNTATVNYDVGGVAQTAETADSNFTVDRAVLLTVAKIADDTVAPGEQDQPLEFTVTNDSNATLDFLLTVEDGAGDDFDAGSYQFYLDDGDGTFNSATDTLIPGNTIDDLAEEGVVTVFVVTDIPGTVTDGQTDDVILVATAYETDGTTIVTEDTGTNGEDTVETVFGDTDGPGAEGDQDGAHSATGTYTVASATIAVTKSSFVLNDPFNGTSNPKAIPGATVIYCIQVANSGGTDASNVAITDAAPTNTTYVNESIRVANSAVTCDAGAITAGAAVTDTDGDADGGNSGPGGNDTGVFTTVTSLPAGGTTTTIFQVAID